MHGSGCPDTSIDGYLLNLSLNELECHLEKSDNGTGKELLQSIRWTLKSFQGVLEAWFPKDDCDKQSDESSEQVQQSEDL